MHIVVVVERLEKFPDFGALSIGKFGKLFWHMAELARHDRPAV